MKYLHKLSRLLLNTLAILGIFILILFISLGLFFSHYKENAINEAKTSYELSTKYYSKLMKDSMLLLDKKEIENLYIEMVNVNPYIKDFKLSNPRYIFDKTTLLHHTSNFKDESWILLDAQTDVYYGEIKKIDGTSYFEFVPSDKFKEDEKLVIRYQLMKNGVLKNLVVAIDLNFMEINNVKSTKTDDGYPFWFKIFYNDDLIDDLTETLKVNQENLVNLSFTIDDKELKDDLYSIVLRMFFLCGLIFLPSIVGLVLFLKYLERRYIKKPMEYLSTVTQHTLEFKFINIDKKMFNNVSEFDDIVKNFKKLSTNIANLKNELNINKEMMERNTLLDNLTGLYDKKLFDLDMKAMFVSSYKGYILCLRISKLNEIAETLGFLGTDNFLISFVNSVNDVIHESSKSNDITFYRFHGSEFVIIAKEFNYDEVYKFSEDIIKNVTTEFLKNYKLPDNIFHLGVVPFDLYGTTDSILKMAYAALTRALVKNENAFEIVSEEELNKEAIQLEKSVKEVVSNSNFAFDFVLDSYTYDSDKLVMRELRPILLDNDKKILPIGAFIAACEKLMLNVDFDKDIVLKALNYIKENQVDYKIAINLSVKTIANFEFLQFVENLVETQKIYIDKIVFSVTSYTAAAFNMEFIRFVSFMNEVGIEVLVKRYKSKDYPIENLSKLGINYIRIDRDLTQNIHQDLMKKHKIKNIVVYSQLNGIKVLTDSVESKKDYDLLSRLDLYATSK